MNPPKVKKIAIQWISVNKTNHTTIYMYLLDSDLSSGWHYLPFEQPGPDQPGNIVFCNTKIKKMFSNQ